MLHCQLLVKQSNDLGAALYGRFKLHQGTNFWAEVYFSRHETIERSKLMQELTTTYSNVVHPAVGLDVGAPAPNDQIPVMR